MLQKRQHMCVVQQSTTKEVVQAHCSKTDPYLPEEAHKEVEGVMTASFIKYCSILALVYLTNETSLPREKK